MIFYQPLSHVDLPVDIESAIRILSNPKTAERIDIPKVDSQVPGPFLWNWERINDVALCVPTIFIYSALGSCPDAISVASKSYASESTQDAKDILTACLCPILSSCIPEVWVVFVA